jgi:HEAT repeat protein
LNPKIIDEKITYALGLLDSKGVPRLLAAFKDHDPNVRRVAVLAIGRMLLTEEIIDRSVSDVCDLIVDSSESVRLAALNTVDHMPSGATHAVPALIKAAKGSRTEAIRTDGLGSRGLAVRVLGHLGMAAHAAASDLRDLLQSPDRALRSEAAIALWRIEQDTNVVTILAEELEQGGPVPSFEILSALGEIGPAAQAAIPVLLRRLGPPDAGFFGRPDALVILQTLEKIDRSNAESFRRRHAVNIESEFIRREMERMRQGRVSAAVP